MKHLLFWLMAFLPTVNLYSQKSSSPIFYCGYGEDSAGISQCTLQQQNSFLNNEQAEKAVEMILSPLGISRNFILISCPNIRNAVAITPEDGIRYIVYDNDFMQKINSAATTDWASTSILAHEIGHHLYGHTLRRSTNPEEQRQKELEADDFSGFVMFKLGASLDHATAAMRLVASSGEDRNSDHPNLPNRLIAIEKGYNRAKAQQPVTKVDVDISAERFFYEGYDLYRQKKYQEAIDKFTAAIQLKPSFVRAYNGRGNSKGVLKNFTGAVADFDTAIMRDNNSVFSYIDRGLAKSFLGDYSGAIADYSVAIALQPNSYLAYNRRGLVKNDNLKDYLGAFADYSRSIEIKPDYGDAYTNRGVSRFNLNDRKGACEDFNRGCKLGNSVGCENYYTACQ